MGDRVRIATRYTIEVLVDGVPAVGEELARLLEAVEEAGSLSAAARRLGIPYSRAWDLVARAERLLGRPLLARTRGGASRGGARLTPLAKEILAAYRSARERLEKLLGPIEAPRLPAHEPGLVVAHSSDPLLEAVLEHLRSSGARLDAVCTGSGLALAMLSLGEADAACMHLYDPAGGSYNLPYLERSWVENPVLLGGYLRQLVLALRPGLETRYKSLKEALEAIRRGKLVVAARNRGSGTALRLFHLLGTAPPRTVGPASTHEEAALLVATGRADAALVVRAAAERYGLPWLHAVWERYECYTTRPREEAARPLAEALSSDWLRRLIETHPGYRLLEEPPGSPAGSPA